jgi:hypothetical protein
MGENQCSNNGTGPVCGLCPDTGVMTTQGCRECPEEEVVAPLRNIAIVLAFFAFILFWLWFSWSPFFPSIGNVMYRVAGFCWNDDMDKKGKIALRLREMYEAAQKLARKAAEVKLPQYFKIFVGFFQVTSSFMSFQVKWPGTFLDALMWLKATINFSVLSLPGVSCLWKTISYRRKLLVYTLAPLFFIFLLAVPVGIALVRVWSTRKNAPKSKVISRRRRCSATLDRFWNGVMFIAFMLYPLLSLITLEPFNCQPAGLGLLAADYREPCPDATSLERIWGAFFILLYPVGIPVASILVLRSMGVHRLAKEKIDAALTAAMINMYIKRTTSVESQKITQLIGPVGEDKDEFARRILALYRVIWPEKDGILDQKDIMTLNIGTSRVRVKILQALDLPRTDTFGSIDPFCWISLMGRRERTNVKKNTFTPSWNKEDFLFEIDKSSETDQLLTLFIEVMDWDQMGENTPVGQVSISSTDIRRIMCAEAGYGEGFELEVQVPTETQVFDRSVSVNCNQCHGMGSQISDTERSTKSKKFWLYVQIENLGRVIAGTEISMFQQFASKYDTDEVRLIDFCGTVYAFSIVFDLLLLLLVTYAPYLRFGTIC